MTRKSPEFIADGGSPFKVYRAGVEISSHTTQRGAASSAGNEKVMYPESIVTFERNLVMRVELVDAEPPVEKNVDWGQTNLDTNENVFITGNT